MALIKRDLLYLKSKGGQKAKAAASHYDYVLLYKMYGTTTTTTIMKSYTACVHSLTHSCMYIHVPPFTVCTASATYPAIVAMHGQTTNERGTTVLWKVSIFLSYRIQSLVVLVSLKGGPGVVFAVLTSVSIFIIITTDDDFIISLID